MAGLIPPEFVDELLARVDIVDVVQSRVSDLKKAGAEFKACCPFHGEKTPSFTVSPAKQFYHCFGCGAHGSAIGFMMEYEHLSFPEAVETLASKVGLELPKTVESVRLDAHSGLYEVMQAAAAFYREGLRREDGEAARKYLQQRGLSTEVIERFGIGFAPAGYQNLGEALSRRFKALELEKAGLTKRSDGGRAYDRFRERVVFPIRDRRGRVVAFGGRVMDDTTPKYLNSPETPIYSKGRELYGLYEARQSVRHLRRLLVVEGYMDVVALAQAGLADCVAALGTAATAFQIESAFRVVPLLVFCFDGDRAGRDAAWRALNNSLALLNAGREARFLFLPEGEDPDSLVRQEGVDGFEQRIGTAMSLSDYLFMHLSEGLDEHDPAGRARLAEQARPLIAQLTDPTLRELLLDELAQRVDLAGTRLRQALRLSAVPGAKTGGAPGFDPTRSPVRMAIAMLCQQPDLAELVDDPGLLKSLPDRGADILVMMIDLCQAQPMNSARLVEAFREHPAYQALCELVAWEPPFAGQDAHGGVELAFRDALAGLQRKALRLRIEKLTRRNDLDEAERDELRRLMALMRGARG